MHRDNCPFPSSSHGPASLTREGGGSEDRTLQPDQPLPEALGFLLVLEAIALPLGPPGLLSCKARPRCSQGARGSAQKREKPHQGTRL